MKRCLWQAVWVGMMMGIFCVGIGWSSHVWAQMEEGTEAADHFQPVPSNLTMKEQKSYEENCPGGPSDKFRLGAR